MLGPNTHLSSIHPSERQIVFGDFKSIAQGTLRGYRIFNPMSDQQVGIVTMPADTSEEEAAVLISAWKAEHPLEASGLDSSEGLAHVSIEREEAADLCRAEQSVR